MVVKIRLARFGKANAPFYNIVVAQARWEPRDNPVTNASENSLYSVEAQGIASPWKCSV